MNSTIYRLILKWQGENTRLALFKSPHPDLNPRPPDCFFGQNPTLKVRRSTKLSYRPIDVNAQTDIQKTFRFLSRQH